MSTIGLSPAQDVTLAAVKAMGMPTEVFRFTQYNGDQHDVECRDEGMAITLCEDRQDAAYVTDLDGNLIAGDLDFYNRA
jgi:hypothetical protein